MATLLVALGGFAIGGARSWVSHAYISAGAYLGVVLAGLFELATHLPMQPVAMGAAWVLTVMLAAWLFLWKVPGDVRRAGRVAPAPAIATTCS